MLPVCENKCVWRGKLVFCIVYQGICLQNRSVEARQRGLIIFGDNDTVTLKSPFSLRAKLIKTTIFAFLFLNNSILVSSMAVEDFWSKIGDPGRKLLSGTQRLHYCLGFVRASGWLSSCSGKVRAPHKTPAPAAAPKTPAMSYRLGHSTFFGHFYVATKQKPRNSNQVKQSHYGQVLT